MLQRCDPAEHLEKTSQKYCLLEWESSIFEKLNGNNRLLRSDFFGGEFTLQLHVNYVMAGPSTLSYKERLRVKAESSYEYNR